MKASKNLKIRYSELVELLLFTQRCSTRVYNVLVFPILRTYRILKEKALYPTFSGEISELLVIYNIRTEQRGIKFPSKELLCTEEELGLLIGEIDKIKKERIWMKKRDISGYFKPIIFDMFGMSISIDVESDFFRNENLFEIEIKKIM